jgi:hypothetical protein
VHQPVVLGFLIKKGKEINLGLSDSCATADFKYSMSGKVISITYLGAGSIQEEIDRILRRIEYWTKAQ